MGAQIERSLRIRDCVRECFTEESSSSAGKVVVAIARLQLLRGGDKTVDDAWERTGNFSMTKK